jgi:hypothetical protein
LWSISHELGRSLSGSVRNSFYSTEILTFIILDWLNRQTFLAHLGAAGRTRDAPYLNKIQLPYTVLSAMMRDNIVCQTE